MWLSVWNVSKMITLIHAFHFMRAIATEPGLELFDICQNYYREKGMIKLRAGMSDIEPGAGFLLGAIIHLEIGLNTLIPKD